MKFYITTCDVQLMMACVCVCLCLPGDLLHVQRCSGYRLGSLCDWKHSDVQYSSIIALSLYNNNLLLLCCMRYE